MLNPGLMQLQANEHIAELRRTRNPRTADERAAASAPSRRRRGGVAAPRQTVGWLLVSAGLRLVVPRPGAGPAR